MMHQSTKKIVLTGATGLVGQRLLPRLAAAGWDCYGMVRGGKGVAPGLKVLEGDLLDPASLDDKLKDVYAVVHLAAVFRTKDMDLIWRSNLDGTRHLIHSLQAQSPGARFIMASTSHVYNIDNPHPGREDDIVSPEHAYPASKVEAEKLLRSSGLSWSILRFPFVYGDGDGHLEMLPKQVVAAGWHPAMKLSTIHHRDIAAAVSIALDGKMDGRIVNITDESPNSIYELVRLIGDTMESSSAPLQHPWYLHADGSLARSLGFRASVRTVYQAMEEGIL